MCAHCRQSFADRHLVASKQRKPATTFGGAGRESKKVKNKKVKLLEGWQRGLRLNGEVESKLKKSVSRGDERYREYPKLRLSYVAWIRVCRS